MHQPSPRLCCASLRLLRSIEQYTLAGALSELAADALPPGVRQGATTLNDLAAAHHRQQHGVEAGPAGWQDVGSSLGDASSSSSSSECDARSVQAGVGLVSPTESPVRHIYLPGQPRSPFSRDQHGSGTLLAGAAAVPPQAPTYQRQDALKMPLTSSSVPSADSSMHASQQQQEPPVQVEVQQQAAARRGPLAWLGLSAGTELRTTPGAAAQFRILLFRSGGWLGGRVCVCVAAQQPLWAASAVW